jgi:hypothetical protein
VDQERRLEEEEHNETLAAELDLMEKA